jgi:3-mercaptopyruvate sulfurtransferase SseA
MELKKLLVVFTIALIAVTLVSCSPASTPIAEATPTLSQEGLPLTEADVPRVTVEEAYTAIQNGEAVVLDVRNLQSYLTSHIAGAQSIPLVQVETDLGSVNLNKQQWIITYCT